MDFIAFGTHLVNLSSLKIPHKLPIFIPQHIEQTEPLIPSEPILPTETSISAPESINKSWASLLKSSLSLPSTESLSTDNLTPNSIIIPITFTPFPIKPRGLVNSGNMCFMNSILQPLVHSPAFYNYFHSLDLKLQNSTYSTPLVSSVIFLLKEFPHAPINQLTVDLEKTIPFSPEYVFDALYHKKQFQNKGRQEDAEEFLGFLLDGLDQELLQYQCKIQKPQNSVDNQEWYEMGPKKKTILTRQAIRTESPISKIFGGSMRSVVKSSGSKDSVTIQPFQSLQLDITPDNVNSIHDALNNLVAPEHLFDFTSKSVSSDATKQTLIEKLPPVLILHLKRFVYESSTNSTLKLCKFVEYDSELILQNNMLSNIGRKNKSTYQLRGVIYHHGKMSSGGHYTCHVKIANNEWIEMDDTQITKISKTEVFKDKKDRQAYMLFYNYDK